jgi:NADH-quinone oxidoreductase subunit L
LEWAQHGNTIGYLLFAFAAITAFLTAFYIWRLIFLAFFGEENPENHPHESPWNMTLPLVVLAVMATVSGLVGTPWANVWGEWIRFGDVHHVAPNYALMLFSVVLGAAGIGLAYILYHKDTNRVKVKELAEKYPALYNLSYRKFYVDEAYAWFTKKIVDGTAKVAYWFDIYIVDGIVNGLAALTRGSGSALRYTQTGKLQTYALVFFLAVLVISVVLTLGNVDTIALLGGVR